MKKFYLIFLMTALAFSAFAQNADPSSPFRTATEAETVLHDNAYNTLRQEINAKLCTGNWEITKTPFLISAHQGEPVVIKDYYKGLGNIPVFTRENETFKISIKQGSSLYQSYTDSMNQPPVNYNKITRISNEMQFANITLLLNEGQTDELRGSLLPKIPGVQQATFLEEKPDETIPYPSFTAVLYIGPWPKPTGGKMNPFPFKKNLGAPAIVNMKITIDAVDRDKFMKAIHGIDWTKLEAMVKK